MDERMSPYKKKSVNVKRILLLMAPIAIVVMIAIIFFIARSSSSDFMIGRVVRIGVDGVGEVVEYQANHQMVVLTIGEDKERRLVVPLQAGESIEILAESRDIYNLENNEDEQKEFVSDNVETEKPDTTSSGKEIDWLAKTEEQLQLEEKSEEGKKQQELRENDNMSSMSDHQDGSSNTPVQRVPTESVGMYERARQNALKSLDDAMKRMSEKADLIDRNWDKYKDSCFGKSTAGDIEMSGGGYVGSIHSRAWFFYQWGGDGTVFLDNEGLPECRMLFHEIKQDFQYIQTRMTEAIRNARISDLYPGDVRDARKKYRLEWDGWEE
jgi:hypothetical protein